MSSASSTEKQEIALPAERLAHLLARAVGGEDIAVFIELDVAVTEDGNEVVVDTDLRSRVGGENG